MRKAFNDAVQRMNRCEHRLLVITIWPPFGAVQSIVLHIYPLLNVFVFPVLTVAHAFAPFTFRYSLISATRERFESTLPKDEN
jgi:hypothetical protein